MGAAMVCFVPKFSVLLWGWRFHKTFWSYLLGTFCLWKILFDQLKGQRKPGMFLHSSFESFFLRRIKKAFVLFRLHCCVLSSEIYLQCISFCSFVNFIHNVGIFARLMGFQIIEKKEPPKKDEVLFELAPENFYQFWFVSQRQTCLRHLLLLSPCKHLGNPVSSVTGNTKFKCCVGEIVCVFSLDLYLSTTCKKAHEINFINESAPADLIGKYFCLYTGHCLAEYLFSVVSFTFLPLCTF